MTESIKGIIRSNQLQINRAIPSSRLEEAGSRIFQKVLVHPAFLSAKSIFCYVSEKDEISTQRILRWILDSGRELSVPRCLGGGIMEACIVHDLRELHKTSYGLMEPHAGTPVQDAPELCIMPCVACTLNGVRLGHGGGYYDRYLSAHRAMKTLMLAGSWQIHASLPCTPNDMQADFVLTDME